MNIISIDLPWKSTTEAHRTLAIANGGTLYQPQLVKAIIESATNEEREVSAKVIAEGFIDSKNLQIVREGMREAVTGRGAPQASAVSLNSLPVAVAAKTGTAQTPKLNYYHNWITVFAPYEDPEIVLTVMIENVKDVQAVVLPIAKEILQWYFEKDK